ALVAALDLDHLRVIPGPVYFHPRPECRIRLQLEHQSATILMSSLPDDGGDSKATSDVQTPSRFTGVMPSIRAVGNQNRTLPPAAVPCVRPSACAVFPV